MFTTQVFPAVTNDFLFHILFSKTWDSFSNRISLSMKIPYENNLKTKEYLIISDVFQKAWNLRTKFRLFVKANIYRIPEVIKWNKRRMESPKEMEERKGMRFQD